MATKKTITSTCLGCVGNCGAVYEVEGDRIVNVKGDPTHPLTRGYTCARGRAVEDLRSSPERLKHPLRRVGEKGQGKWQRISWDQATDEMAQNYSRVREEYGPEAFVLAIGFAGVLSGFNPVTTKFLHSFGSPNRLEDLHN